jgi:hypothetical protein
MIYAFSDGRSSTIDLYSSSGSWIVNRELLEVYDVGVDLSHRWHHIDVTRDDEGRICIYLNRKLVIDLVDKSCNSSSFFQFLSESGPAIDNIVVKDYVDPPQITEWSEDFDDRDLEEWLVRGNWSASTQTVQAFYDPEIVEYQGGYFFSRIKRPNNITYGTWSFDLLLKDSKYILFSFLNFRDDQDRWNDYYFEIKPTKQSTGFYLGKTVKHVYGLITKRIIFNDLTEKWIHFDITRDVQGRFHVFLDGEVILEMQNNELTYSDFFGIYSEPNGPIIDNIHVRDVIDVFSPINFEVAVNLPEKPVIQGEEVLVTLRAKDYYGVVIPRMSFNVLFDDEVVDVFALGGGIYEVLLDTASYSDVVDLVVFAEKDGFVPIERTYGLVVVVPASFDVSGLSITPSSVQVGESVLISVDVSNIGGQEGSYNVILNVNEVVEDEREVRLDVGGSTNIIFEYMPSVSGNYTAVVGDLSGSFTVITREIEEPNTDSEDPDTDTGWRIPGFPVMSILLALFVISSVLNKENIRVKF